MHACLRALSGAAGPTGATVANLTGAFACMQAVSAGIRPQLDRTQEAGPSTVRAAVLSVAQQQKLATCTALLREVAMVYGFALHADPVTWARRLLVRRPPLRVGERREEQPNRDILDPAPTVATSCRKSPMSCISILKER